MVARRSIVVAIAVLVTLVLIVTGTTQKIINTNPSVSVNQPTNTVPDNVETSDTTQVVPEN